MPNTAPPSTFRSATISVLVENEAGVLARVIGLFSGRGYNIDSLTVSETESQKHLSRITIVTTGTPMVIQQIKHQLDRMIPIYKVVDMTLIGARSIYNARPVQAALSIPFTTVGETPWTVPTGVTKILIQADGAAGLLPPRQHEQVVQFRPLARVGVFAGQLALLLLDQAPRLLRARQVVPARGAARLVVE